MLTFLKQTIDGTGLSSPGPRTGKFTLPSQVISDSGRQGCGGSQKREGHEESKQLLFFSSN